MLKYCETGILPVRPSLLTGGTPVSQFITPPLELGSYSSLAQGM